ncbi:MAG TPA: CHRD domain-containing protein [Gemmatimonadaceae bacterium]|jgi:CHRD domain-containing protein|nr:CHRD domain-containing protein [Gemmatimonadaceae bacterium]
MTNRIPAFAIAALAALVAACGSDDSTTTPTPVSNVVTFTANLAGNKENPANTSQGTGTFLATLDTVTGAFTYDVSFQGMTSNVTLGHIHGPAAATANASPILNFGTLPGALFTTGGLSGTAHGSTTLNAANQLSPTINGDSLKKLLLAGLTYVNIHTTQNGGGEIRAQLTK